MFFYKAQQNTEHYIIIKMYYAYSALLHNNTYQNVRKWPRFFYEVLKSSSLAAIGYRPQETFLATYSRLTIAMELFRELGFIPRM
jgi:hypothetical protein